MSRKTLTGSRGESENLAAALMNAQKKRKPNDATYSSRRGRTPTYQAENQRPTS